MKNPAPVRLMKAAGHEASGDLVVADDNVRYDKDNCLLGRSSCVRNVLHFVFVALIGMASSITYLLFRFLSVYVSLCGVSITWYSQLGFHGLLLCFCSVE